MELEEKNERDAEVRVLVVDAAGGIVFGEGDERCRNGIGGGGGAGDAFGADAGDESLEGPATLSSACEA